MMRFDRFTERAQEAAQRAAEIIQRYGHNQIDTEHILLALIEQPGGVIPQILETLKVDANALTEQWTSAAADIQKTKIAPKKSDIDVQMVALAWAPTWEVTYEDSRGRSRTDAVPAYPGTQAA